MVIFDFLSKPSVDYILHYGNTPSIDFVLIVDFDFYPIYLVKLTIKLVCSEYIKDVEINCRHSMDNRASN